MEDLEKNVFPKALGKTKGIKRRALEVLYINFRSMRYRLEKYGLSDGLNNEMDS